MGKGYNNYMCKKPFHPGSKANIKRAWMAEQKTENEKKKQDELKVQYEKEQDLYNNRALISTESKDKLELNFMYEAPPGAKRERQKEDDEPEYKFEWQRKYNAPREDYAKGNADIKDQPFGIPVRNVRCIKCHKWGHINTDKECPLFSQASTSSMPTTSMDPMELMRQMREDGYGLKENVLGHHLNPKAANQQLIPSDESDPEMEFLKSLSTMDKKKLLRKLKKLSKKQEKSANCKKKKSKKSRKSKHSSDSDCGGKKKSKKSKKTVSNSSSDSLSDESEVKVKKEKKKMRKKSLKSKKESSSESSSTDSEPEETKELSKRSKHAKNEKLKHSDEIKFSAKHGGKDYLKPRSFDTKHKIEKDESKYANKGKTPERSNKKDFVVNTSKQSSKKQLIHHSKDKFVSSNSEDELSSKPDKSSIRHKEYKKIEKRKKDKTVKSSKLRDVESKSDISDENKSNGRKRKSDEEDTKDIRAKRKKSDSSYSEENNKVDESDHPDGFSHVNPQAVIESNYVQSETEYQGGSDEIFRSLHRKKRSPSVKQKYKK